MPPKGRLEISCAPAWRDVAECPECPFRGEWMVHCSLICLGFAVRSHRKTQTYMIAFTSRPGLRPALMAFSHRMQLHLRIRRAWRMRDGGDAGASVRIPCMRLVKLVEVAGKCL
jgi:hypothetical protein